MVTYKKNGIPGVLRYLFVFAWLLGIGQQVTAFSPLSKENIFADVLLTEILNRMDKDMVDPMGAYFDIESELPKNVDLLARSSKDNGPDDFEYRNIFGGASNPSIRDQEYLQHSSLWGHQYVSGGMGEMPNHYPNIVKTDASLPAYCNPPNPCPYGYDESKGCIADFENTAIFSREFQASQECTCDNEHMFDCAAQDSSANTNEMTSTMEKFLMHQFQNENAIDNSNNVVKKFYNDKMVAAPPQGYPVTGRNPYLEGEKLPIAAKKGDHIRV